MSAPEPGYYVDPDDPSKERWWNGRTWVGQTRNATGTRPALDGVMPVGAPVEPMTAPATQGTRPCPDCGHVVSVRAESCIHCGAPLADLPPVRTAVGSPAQAERSGYYTAAWVCVFFCSPLAIIFNLMDNSVSKTKGLPPTYTPMIVAVILWIVAYLLWSSADLSWLNSN